MNWRSKRICLSPPHQILDLRRFLLDCVEGCLQSRERTIEGHVQIAERSRADLACRASGSESTRVDRVPPFFSPPQAKAHPEVVGKAQQPRGGFRHFAIDVGVFNRRPRQYHEPDLQPGSSRPARRNTPTPRLQLDAPHPE